MNAKMQTRLRLVLAVVVLICGVSLMALVYLIINKPVTEVTPSIAVSHPSPVAVPVVNNNNLLLKNRTIAHHAPYHQAMWPRWGVASSTSSSFMIYTTSSATPYSVGSSGGSVYVTATASHSPQRGIRQQSLPVNTFVAMASTRQLSAPEAEEAPQMARLVSADRHRAPGPPNPGGDELPGDHQLVEQPAGDGLLEMLLMGMLYIYCIRLRRAGTRKPRPSPL